MSVEMAILVCLAFLFLALIFIMSAWSVYSGIANLYLRRKLTKRGIHAVATVSDVHFTHSFQGSGIYPYRGTLKYVADNRRQTVKKLLLRRFKEGETVEIVYLPESPQKLMFTDWVKGIKGILHDAISIAAHAFILGLFIRGFYRLFSR